MLTSLFDTAAMQAARAALGGLTRRQESISANVANIDTPGYQRRSVNFESALQSELNLSTTDQTSPRRLRTSDPRHLSGRSGSVGDTGAVEERDVLSTRNDSNNVSIDEEMTLMVETQIRYQALTQSVGRRIGTLRTVIRG
jgi:flagellar basal-body rod protein FlgB